MAKELKMSIGALANPLNCSGCAARSIWEGNTPKTIYLTITPGNNDGKSSAILTYCYLCARERMLSLSNDLEKAWTENYNQEYKEFKHNNKD